MTANVTFIYDHRDSALRVANAALRFQPPAELTQRGLGRRRRRRQWQQRRSERAARGGGGRRGRRATTPGAARAARRRTGGRSGLLRGPTPTPVACAPASATAPTPEIETAELHEGDRVVTDAEFAGRRQQGGAAAGSGAFRRMF